MSRLRLWYFIFLGYIFTFAVLLPVPFFQTAQSSFGEVLMFKAMWALIFWFPGTLVGIACIAGADALHDLIEGTTRAKENTNHAYLLGTCLVVGLLVYSLLVAWRQTHLPPI